MRPPLCRAKPAAALFALACLAALPGCLRSVAFTEGDPYPTQFETLAPSNIQLYRSGRSITLTNTTAQNFGPSTLWLNRWFRRDIQGLGVGETLTLSLAGFTDEYGDAFKGGGFFATTAPERIVHAELEIETQSQRVMLPLVVVGQREY